MFAYIGFLGVLFQGGLLRRLLKWPIEKQLAIIGSLLMAGSMIALTLIHSTGALLITLFFISLGNSFVSPTLTGLASRSTDAYCQGRLIGLMQSAGSLGRFLGPMIGFTLISFSPVGNYGQFSFFASATLLLLSTICIVGVFPPKPTIPISEGVLEV